MNYKLTSLLSIGVLLITSFATCKKDCIKVGYSFSVGVKAHPDYDSISRGDTIWLELKESVNLKDLNTGYNIYYTGAKNLGSVIALGEMLGNGIERYALKDFQFDLQEGNEVQSIDPNRFKEYLFTEKDGYYIFKLAIIPQKQGIYRIGLSNAANVYTSQNPCGKSSFLINFKETDQHLYYNQWNFGVMPTLPNGVYSFKVK